LVKKRQSRKEVCLDETRTIGPCGGELIKEYSAVKMGGRVRVGGRKQGMENGKGTKMRCGKEKSQ